MDYQAIWSSERVTAGQYLSLDDEMLRTIFDASGQHIGTMADMIVERTGVTRGDGSRIAEKYFDRVIDQELLSDQEQF